MKVSRSCTGAAMPILVSLLSVLIISSGCKKKSSDPAVTPTDDPSEETGSLKLSSVAPYISIVSPISGESESASLTEDEAAKLDETDPQTLKENLQTLFGAAETVEDCLVGVDRTQAANNGPSCYGPSLYISEHHPDGTWSGAEANSWFLPSGDLGIWSAEHEGEACTAAKMNSLIETLRQQAQSGIEAALRAGCIARVLEKTLPTTVDEELDLLEDVNTAITEAEIDNFTFSTLTITLDSSDATAGNVYTTVLAAETPNADVWTRVTQRRESDTKTSGYIWTTIKAKNNTPALNGPPPAAEQSYVTSVFFNEDGDNLSYEATRSRTVDATEEQAMEADPTVMFDTDKRVRMADSSNPGYDHIITEMNTATGAGETVYLWTAGGKDEEQRVMHAIVEVEGETKTATGYFGFGKKLKDMRDLVKEGTITATTPSIEGMICNWAGPGHSHETVAYAQKQVMEFDAETGLFAASTNKISYQPSKLCGEGADKDTDFKFALPDNNTRPADGEFAAFADFDLQDISSGEDKDALVMPELISIDF
ncbi:MAG: hypothetical protein KBD78_03210 [Oligoflexales bacterium]|nr:hypothetical protein [Oligoflexales bacterium]